MSRARPSNRPRLIDGCLIHQCDDHWQLICGDQIQTVTADSSPRDRARAVAELISANQLRRPRCVLALATPECFFTTLDAFDGIDPNDSVAMSFELERFFPLDAEAMVACVTVQPRTGRLAALAVSADRHREFADALRSEGLELEAIVPWSFLVARGLIERRDVSNAVRIILNEPSSSSREILQVDRDGIWQWKHASDLRTSPTVKQSADAGLSEPAATVVIGTAHAPAEPQAESELVSAEPSSESAEQLGAAGVDVLLAGRWGRWPDLRRGVLAPSDPLHAVASQLRWLAIAAAVCLLTVTAAGWMRNRRLTSDLETVMDQQRRAFRQTFPDRSDPVLLMRTVRSEHRKALGSKGQGVAVPLPIPATEVLRRIYQGLKRAGSEQESRFRVLDIDIVDGECALTVRTRDARQLGVIANSLQANGFQVSPPASEQVEPSRDEPVSTYQSTIVAVLPKSSTGSTDEATPGGGT
ncbi:hypothetical protein FYK55_19520 [Roseiconus nitratireducens]|uniref:General secretion pathway protein L n=1 Tax=Roseiconus nitratireducens TaxID=2605748 RepID=A0A5M6D0V6_9BACT|nr:hypothetical protein [Roseiconus nitratireducens]KAA5541084.1 hypothetical protein FYK55_19520 [Roseiconus nitratireducens]